MILGEIIQRVQSLYSKGVQSDDTRLSRRHIYNKLLTARTKLLELEADKKQKISHWSYQSLPCVELEEANLYNFPLTPPKGCKILKTKYPLPKLITDLNRHLIKSVMSIDGEITYSELQERSRKYKKANKYTANKPDFFLKEGNLYITHRKGPKIISITGLFEDPVEALQYPSYCEKTTEDCKSILDMEFPIESDSIDTLVKMAANELIILFSKNIEDLTNNAEDDTVKQSK